MSLAVSAVEGLRRLAWPGWRARFLYSIIRGVFACVPIRRSLVLESLRLSFPEQDESWRRATLKKIYQHYAWMLVEVLAVQNDPSLVTKMAVEVEGLDVLNELKASGKGCFILTGHMGNWEFSAAWINQAGFPTEAAVRDPDNADFAELIETYRRRVGLVTLRKGALGVRNMIKHARDGKWIGLLADQDAGPNAVPVTFLGRRTTMVEGPAALSLTAEVPLIGLYSVRRAPFQYTIKITPAILTGNEGRSREHITDYTLKANEVLEEMVRTAPEQWFWFHRRWKNNPDAPR
ncbi:MAG: hypothetical protein SOZ52_04255 [Pyramidobacter sp.]|nr:hypothetical protein [Pyramidobacter sp.]